MGTLVSDSFTESSDTALASHTPDTDSVGLGWNEETTTTVLAATDDVSCASADDGGWIDVGTPDQKVSIKFTANADNRMTVNARSGSAHTTGSQPDNGYLFNCRPSPNLMYIYERSSSSNTQLGSSISKTMVASTQFDFKITIEGSSTDNINVYVDSVLEGTRTDATHTTGDYAGFTHNLRNTSAARFDDFLVEDFGSGAALESSLNGSASIAASLTTAITFAAALSGSAAITADLTTGISLAATPSASASVAADLTTQIALAGTALGSASVSADLTVGNAIAADVSASATVSADLTTQITLNTSVSAVSSILADLSTSIEMAAALTGSGVVVADLSTQITMAASLSASGSVLAALTTGDEITASGLQYTLPENRLHYKMSDNKLHYTLKPNRLHYKV